METMKKRKQVEKFDNHERFLSKIRINQENECWEWQGYLGIGYGQFSIGYNNYKAHRVSWSIFKGDMNLSLVIDHICMNKSCVNPDHLREVSSKVNVTENIKRETTYCPSGHVNLDRNPIDGRRKECRICKKLRSSRRNILWGNNEHSGVYTGKKVSGKFILNSNKGNHSVVYKSHHEAKKMGWFAVTREYQYVNAKK